MAIYHLSAQVISRSAGRSAVAAAAYRAGEKLADERLGQVYDFTRKQVDEQMIMAPENAPEWVHNREQLWNAVEMVEKRKDAQLCREINIALPRELSKEKQLQLMKDYCQEQFVNRGMVVDLSIHRNDPNNPHAHIMLTTRTLSPEGFGQKNREWNNSELLQQWRESWADRANLALERAGIQERIDHRSFKDQGIHDRLPTTHEGPNVREMEKRGVKTERGDLNRLAKDYNAVVVELEAYRKKKTERELNEKGYSQEPKQLTGEGIQGEGKGEVTADKGTEKLIKQAQEGLEMGDINREIQEQNKQLEQLINELSKANERIEIQTKNSIPNEQDAEDFKTKENLRTVEARKVKAEREAEDLKRHQQQAIQQNQQKEQTIPDKRKESHGSNRSVRDDQTPIWSISDEAKRGFAIATGSEYRRSQEIKENANLEIVAAKNRINDLEQRKTELEKIDREIAQKQQELKQVGFFKLREKNRIKREISDLTKRKEAKIDNLKEERGISPQEINNKIAEQQKNLEIARSVHKQALNQARSISERIKDAQEKHDQQVREKGHTKDHGRDR